MNAQNGRRAVLLLMTVALATPIAFGPAAPLHADDPTPAPDPRQGEPAPPDPDADERTARADAIERLCAYKSSLEGILPLYQQDVVIAADRLDARRRLHAEGHASPEDVEGALRAHVAARAKLDEMRVRIVEAGRFIAEVVALEILATRPPTPGPVPLIYFAGANGWSLSAAGKIQSFFAAKFRRPLPITAFGQTPVHDRMAFDHRNAFDVAIHPDSREGQALLEYLRSTGTPFLAFRSAVAGAATGAHIHVGRPSQPLPARTHR
jgi:hypothetical protein